MFLFLRGDFFFAGGFNFVGIHVFSELAHLDILADNLSRITGDDAMGRDVFGHHTASRHNGMMTNSNSRQDNAARTDETVIFNTGIDEQTTGHIVS